MRFGKHAKVVDAFATDVDFGLRFGQVNTLPVGFNFGYVHCGGVYLPQKAFLISSALLGGASTTRLAMMPNFS
jgi:hypothetical protein